MDSSATSDADLGNQHHSLASSVSSDDLNASVYDDEFSDITPEELYQSRKVSSFSHHYKRDGSQSHSNAQDCNENQFQEIKVVSILFYLYICKSVYCFWV